MEAVGDYEKDNNAIIAAVHAGLIWHGEHPWPLSVGFAEVLFQGVPDPHIEKTVLADGVSFQYRDDRMQRYEYVEARRDCSLTIVETEDFHWVHRGEIMFDRELGSISDALRWCARYYEALLAGGNQCRCKITWHRLDGLRLTVMEEQFIRKAQTLVMSPRVGQHAAPVSSVPVQAVAAQFKQFEGEFVRQISGFLFGQFQFDPTAELREAVLKRYHQDFRQASQPVAAGF